jgi:hypothetical protein
MAFGRAELTKEDLVKAGLNPDDLADMKANGVKKADLEAFQTTMATSIAEQIKNQFAELETKLTRPANNGNNNNNGNDNNGNNNNGQQTNDEAFAEYVADPISYINKRVGQSVGFTAVQTTKTRMDLALDRAKSSNPLFKNQALTEEIMAEWGQYKPEHCAMNKDFDPDKLLTKICNMVKGSHAEEIQRDTDKREGKFNMVSSGNSGGNNNFTNNDNIGTKKPEDMMTDMEKRQAARYGMKPEEWVKQQKEMSDEESKVLMGGV